MVKLKTEKNKRVSKTQWLTLALEILPSEGIQGVRVERLARDLGIAKSGFYWHFKDRNDLLQSILEYWKDEFTAIITEGPEFQLGEAKQRLYNIMHAIMDHGLAKYDLAIRQWATHDPAAAEAVQSVCQMRLDFVRSLFSEIGFRGKQLEMRARLFVTYHTWEANTFDDLTENERRSLLRLQHKLLIAK